MHTALFAVSCRNLSNNVPSFIFYFISNNLFELVPLYNVICILNH